MQDKYLMSSSVNAKLQYTCELPIPDMRSCKIENHKHPYASRADMPCELTCLSSNQGVTGGRQWTENLHAEQACQSLYILDEDMAMHARTDM